MSIFNFFKKENDETPKRKNRYFLKNTFDESFTEIEDSNIGLEINYFNHYFLSLPEDSICVGEYFLDRDEYMMRGVDYAMGARIFETYYDGYSSFEIFELIKG